MTAVGVVLLAIVVATAAIGLPQLAQGDAVRQPVGERGAAAPADRGARPAGRDQTGANNGAVLQIPGPVPQEGTGEFAFAAGGGPILGRSGTVRRFRVAVEEGSPEEADRVAVLVDETLGDSRSWTGDGRTRMQRVSAAESADFTIYLAMAQTASRMCLAGGVDIRVQGDPYTSCRAPGKVILNLSRWQQSVPEYIELGVPLRDYRQYVINHEVGHELGHGHEECPGAGRPAPVMVQQTLTLRGCRPYAWPRLDGSRYEGPAAESA